MKTMENIMSTHQINSLMSLQSQTNHSGLKGKLQTLIQQKKDKHLVDDDNFISLPGMGLLKLRHVALEEPIFLFHNEFKEKNIVEIEIYTAKQHRVTKKIEPLEMRNKVQMTIAQYSDLLINMNSGGTKATITHIDSQELPAFDKSQDPSYQYLSKLEELTTTNSDEQIYGFFDKVQDILDTAITNKKIKTSELKDVIHYLKNADNNAFSNYTFYLKEYGKQASKITEKALLSAHVTCNYMSDGYAFSQHCQLTKK